MISQAIAGDSRYEHNLQPSEVPRVARMPMELCKPLSYWNGSTTSHCSVWARNRPKSWCCQTPSSELSQVQQQYWTTRYRGRLSAGRVGGGALRARAGASASEC